MTAVECIVAVDASHPGVVTLTMRGRLDVWTGATLLAVVDQQPPDHTVLLDLSAVTDADRGGLDAIDAGRRRRRGMVAILVTSPAVDAVLDHDLAGRPRTRRACDGRMTVA